MVNKLLNELCELKKEIWELLSERKSQLDKYDVNALSFIINYLEQIIYECNTGQLKPKNKRYSHLARMIADRDSSLISENLGQRLIMAEKMYIEQP